MPEPQPAAAHPPGNIDGESAPAVSLKNLALRGTFWTIVGFGSSQILRLAFNLIVARLLFPELFGLMALVWAILYGIGLFCDIGIGPAVVRDPHGDTPVFLNTAWTVQILRGFGLALLCALLAYPAALFYGDARLRWVLPLIGLTSIAGGFNSTSLFTLHRDMAVRRFVAMDLGAQVISGAVMAGWAWLHPGVWALIAGSLAPSLVRLIWSHFLEPERRDRIAWDRAALAQLLVFGRWIWISSILTFLAGQIDRLILGKLVALEMLGVYGIATMFAEAPRSLLQALNHNVIFPAYSKMAQLSRAELRERILRHRWRLLLIVACGLTALTAGGDLLIYLLYDKRYAAGSWMLPLLAIGIWPSALSLTIESALYAVGRPRYSASANLLKTVFTAAGIPLGFWLAGTTGAVIVVALNDLPYYGRIAYGLQREGLSSFAQDLSATALLAAMLAAAFAARWAGGLPFPIHR